MTEYLTLTAPSHDCTRRISARLSVSHLKRKYQYEGRPPLRDCISLLREWSSLAKPRQEIDDAVIKGAESQELRARFQYRHVCVQLTKRCTCTFCSKRTDDGTECRRSLLKKGPRNDRGRFPCYGAISSWFCSYC
jgi:hypothetical protein